MNKYQEAFDVMVNNMGDVGFYTEVTLMQELVDKATPKKVIDKKEELHGMSFICPNCGKKVYTNFIRNYCGECGQRLDWSK